MGLARPRVAEAHSPYLVVPDAAEAESTAAYRYANMTNEEAFAELDRRNVPYIVAEPLAGVRAPVRLTGRLHGVSIHSALPLEARQSSVYEVLDARLALMLDDFCVLLERHEIDEVVHYSLYRPNVPKEPEKPVADPILPIAPKKQTTKPGLKETTKVSPNAKDVKELEKPALKTKEGKKSQPKGQKGKSPAAAESGKKQEMLFEPTAAKGHAKPTKIAKKVVEAPRARAKALHPIADKPEPGKQKAAIAEKPIPAKAEAKPQRRWAPPGTRHPAGLAIDVGMLHKKDGTWLSVQGAFQGKIGAPTCGQGVPWPADEAARELRSLVCEANEQGMFTYILTPNYDRAHADHFHMEIKPGVHWFLVH